MDELDIVRQFDNFDEAAFSAWSVTTQDALDDAFAAERRGTSAPLTIIDGDLEIIAAPYIAVPPPTGFHRRRGAVLAAVGALVVAFVAASVFSRPAGEVGVATAPPEGTRPAPSAPAGGRCRLGASCTVTNTPAAIDIVPVPTGLVKLEAPPSAGDPGTPDQSSLEVIYRDAAAVANPPVGPMIEPPRQIRVAAARVGTAVIAAAPAQHATWRRIAIGDRTAYVSPDAGPGRPVQIDIVANGEVIVFVTGQGFDAAELQTLVGSVTIG